MSSVSPCAFPSVIRYIGHEINYHNKVVHSMHIKGVLQRHWKGWHKAIVIEEALVVAVVVTVVENSNNGTRILIKRWKISRGSGSRSNNSKAGSFVIMVPAIVTHVVVMIL